MLSALRHRGPDDEGTEQDAAAILGFRRLSIIDLEGGRQPLTNADRSIWLVCNGEIYNHEELRARSKPADTASAPHSDCEVIIALYERYGDRLLDHAPRHVRVRACGMRASAACSPRAIISGRSRSTTRARARGFAFASEIKALLAFDPVAAPDEPRSARSVSSRCASSPRRISMFRGVHKLPPGHLLVLEDGARAGRPPLLGPELSAEARRAREDALVDELEERLEETLRLHMVSDVPVGAFLSGGLDSSLLVAMLAKRVGVKNLPTFTVGLPHARFDEAPHARAVARALRHGAPRAGALAVVSVSLLPDVVHHLDEPSDPLSLCAYHVSALAHRHVKVVIGGDGGDELFGGYDRYYGNLYASHYSRVPVGDPAVRARAGAAADSRRPAGTRAWGISCAGCIAFRSSGGERYAASLSYFYFDRDGVSELFTPEAVASAARCRPRGRDPRAVRARARAISSIACCTRTRKSACRITRS